MIKTIPTLIAFVSLAIPASAESDAAFAASLGDIQFSTQQMAQAQKTAPKKRSAKAKKPQAPATAPAASEAVWQKIVEAVKKDGKYDAGTRFIPASFTLEDVEGDLKADHTQRLVTFIGTVNDEDQFEALGAMISVMKYVLDPKTGNFNVDQWLFEVDLYGEVTDSAHITGQMTPAGKPVAPPTPDKLAAGDAKIKTAYDGETKFWSERSPK